MLFDYIYHLGTFIVESQPGDWIVVLELKLWLRVETANVAHIIDVSHHHNVLNGHCREWGHVAFITQYSYFTDGEHSAVVLCQLQSPCTNDWDHVSMPVLTVLISNKLYR